MPIKTPPPCPPGSHYTEPDGWVRCDATPFQMKVRTADAKVCPFCTGHYAPDRGSAVVHVRACAKRHGAVWPH